MAQVHTARRGEGTPPCGWVDFTLRIPVGADPRVRPPTDAVRICVGADIFPEFRLKAKIPARRIVSKLPSA